MGSFSTSAAAGAGPRPMRPRLFVGGTADMTMTERDGDLRYVNTRFHKPIVAIIDEGTRSGMEILAYSLKKNGIPLVGSRTARHVARRHRLHAARRQLPVGWRSPTSMSMAAPRGQSVSTPDIAVPFDVRYAAGADPQMDRAVAEMGKRLTTGVN